MKAFNDLADFSTEEIVALIELAGRLDKHPEPEALKGKVLSLLFLSPSLRTLASFQAAMTRLGGGSFVISPEMSIHGLGWPSPSTPHSPCHIFSVLAVITSSVPFLAAKAR